jgi:mono/diheme cytochrome c family protein
MTANTDRELFDTVTNGRPGTGMPAWGKILNENDRWSVIAYIRTLSTP